MWQTPVSNVSPWNSTPFASSSARAAPTSSTWSSRDRWVFREGTPTVSTLVIALVALADTALHLQLDEAVHLDRVLERQLLGDRLDEPGHDHRARLRLGEP